MLCNTLRVCVCLLIPRGGPVARHHATQLDDVGHHRVGDAGDVRPAGQGLMKTSYALSLSLSLSLSPQLSRPPSSADTLWGGFGGGGIDVRARRRKLPKLRSMRETTSTEEGRSQAKLTATVLAKVLEARRETGGESVLRLHELANRLHVEQSALEAVLRYHDDLPEYKVATLPLADFLAICLAWIGD